MSNVKKSGEVANWINDFISSFSGKGKKSVTATTNIEDLPKVSWNDDTYHVQFTQEDANILNDYANKVLTVENVNDMGNLEEVLNGDVVVRSASNEEAEVIDYNEGEEDLDDINNELKKIADYINSEENEIMDALSNEETEEIYASNDEETKEVYNQGEDDKVKKIAKLESEVAFLQERLAQVEQMYARINTFGEDSNYTHDEEFNQMQDSAKHSEELLKKEQSIDLTTPAGRVEYSNSHNKSEIEDVVSESIVTTCEDCNCEECECDIESVSIGDSCPLCDCEVCECGMNNNEEVSENIQKLSGQEEEMFKSGICPFTSEELIKSDVSGNFIGVYSSSGKTEYAVDLTDGSIYFYKG